MEVLSFYKGDTLWLAFPWKRFCLDNRNEKSLVPPKNHNDCGKRKDEKKPYLGS